MSAQQATEIVRLSVVNTELRSRVEELENATLAADLEALRAKAGAVCSLRWPVTSESPHYHALVALRAELEKPSGASLLAEIASLRAALQREGEQVTLFQGERGHASPRGAAAEPLGCIRASRSGRAMSSLEPPPPCQAPRR